MNDPERNKQVIRELLDLVSRDGNLDALPRFWTEDCVNYAAPAGTHHGLAALHAYYAGVAVAFAAFSDPSVEVLRQTADGDLVATHYVTYGVHTGTFASVPATGRRVGLSTMRMDRMRDGRIAEHWSITDVTGLVGQLLE